MLGNFPRLFLFRSLPFTSFMSLLFSLLSLFVYIYLFVYPSIYIYLSLHFLPHRNLSLRDKRLHKGQTLQREGSRPSVPLPLPPSPLNSWGRRRQPLGALNAQQLVPLFTPSAFTSSVFSSLNLRVSSVLFTA